MIPPQDQYPSTEDCGSGHEPDLALACIINARKRVDDGWTQGAYIGVDGLVCPLGSVLAVDGLTSDDMDANALGMELYMSIESQLSDEAKEAIRLLNQAALQRHPEAAQLDRWSGPLEWVNQEWANPEGEDANDPEPGDAPQGIDWCFDEFGYPDTKAEILAIYDLAIDNRRRSVV